MNSHILLNQMKRKLIDGSDFTEEDLKNIAAAASAIGSIESRVTYSAVKQKLNSQNEVESDESKGAE